MIVALAAGAATLAVAIGFGLLPETAAARTACDGELPSIIAFELMREPADYDRVFGPPGTCRDAGVAALNAANRLDLVLFIPSYAVFLATAGFVAFRRSGLGAGWVPAALSAVAAAGDVVETRALRELTAPAADFGALLGTLQAGTWVKWLALAAIGGAVLRATLAATPPRKALAAAAVPVLVLTPLAFVWPERLGVAMSLANGLLWVGLLAATIAAARAQIARSRPAQ